MSTLDKDIKILMLKGERGDPCAVSIGDVTTGEAGSDASVTNSGTSGDVVLNFTIPRGDKGDKGDPGPIGSIEEGSVVPIENGGTNATTANAALNNLGALPYAVKTNTDFDSMTTPGLYTMKTSSTNAPTTGSYHSLIVNKSDTGNYVQQLAIKEGSTQMYIRYGASPWSSWKQIALSETVPVNESGTWTPIMDFWGLDQYDGTYTTSDSYYFKIGGMVHIQCRINFTSTPSSGYQISLHGLPFVSSGYSVGSFNLNSDADMQGDNFQVGVFRIAKKDYGTFADLGTGDIANNRYLTISATYRIS